MLEIVGRIVAYVASFGMLGGLIYAVVAAGARAKARRVASWPHIKGHILSPPMAPFALGALSQGLRYRYQVDGQLHEGRRLTLLDWPAAVWPHRDAFAQRFAAAGYVSILVNPKLSDDTLLDPAAPPVRAIYAGLAFALVCGAFLLVRRLL